MQHIFGIVIDSNRSQTEYIENQTVLRNEGSNIVCPFLVDYISAKLPAIMRYVWIYLGSIP